MTPRAKTALWTGSVALFLYVLRRVLVGRGVWIDAGSVSNEWLAQQRVVADDLAP